MVLGALRRSCSGSRGSVPVSCVGASVFSRGSAMATGKPPGRRGQCLATLIVVKKCKGEVKICAQVACRTMRDIRTRYVDAVVAGDLAAPGQLIDGVDVRTLYLEVLQPALYEIGRRWEEAVAELAAAQAVDVVALAQRVPEIVRAVERCAHWSSSP